jgi:hypothetical protein
MNGSAFQTIFAELEIELAATKMCCAEVVVKARRTREHVRRCRGRRNGSKWSPEPEPIFVNERSGHVH